MRPAERVVHFVACRRCSGSKREACSACGGHGFAMRSTMRTRYDGHVDYRAERVACAPCYGVGWVPCMGCGGRGQVIR
jgi:RecJ-like exonuclease